jgi:hypothetical protein
MGQTKFAVVTDSRPLPLGRGSWTTHSLGPARQAYLSHAVISTHPGSQSYDVSWEGRSPYDNRCRTLLVDQMRLGAKNLSSVVNGVYG